MAKLNRRSISRRTVEALGIVKLTDSRLFSAYP